MDKKLAIYFDSDNVSADYVDFVFGKLKSTDIIVKRAFRDWSKPSNWNKDLLEKYAIKPEQIFSCAKAKNATDIAITIAVLDEINKGIVSGIVIVSSDSDFSALIDRIRANGLEAIGFGENKTLLKLRNAYNEFIELPQKNIDENKSNDKSKANQSTQTKTATPKTPAKPKATATKTTNDTLDKEKLAIVTKAFKVCAEDGWCDIGKLGTYFKNNNIDSKIFGSSLKKFFKKYPKNFELQEKEGKKSNSKKRPFVKLKK